MLGLDRHMLCLDADTPPLIDNKDARGNEGVVERAIDEFELEIGMAGLLQQAPGLGAGLFDVAVESGNFLKLAYGQRPGRAGPEGSANPFDQRNLAECLRAGPSIDGERAAYPNIIERFVLGVEGQQDICHPWP